MGVAEAVRPASHTDIFYPVMLLPLPSTGIDPEGPEEYPKH